jgi:hypothetical protein
MIIILQPTITQISVDPLYSATMIFGVFGSRNLYQISKTWLFKQLHSMKLEPSKNKGYYHSLVTSIYMSYMTRKYQTVHLFRYFIMKIDFCFSWLLIISYSSFRIYFQWEYKKTRKQTPSNIRRNACLFISSLSVAFFEIYENFNGNYKFDMHLLFLGMSNRRIFCLLLNNSFLS